LFTWILAVLLEQDSCFGSTSMRYKRGWMPRGAQGCSPKIVCQGSGRTPRCVVERNSGWLYLFNFILIFEATCPALARRQFFFGGGRAPAGVLFLLRTQKIVCVGQCCLYKLGWSPLGGSVLATRCVRS